MTSRGNSTTGWMIAGIGVTAMLGLGSLLAQYINPKGDIAAVEVRIDAKYADFKNDYIKFKDEVRWTFQPKDENKTYREGLERLIGRIETKANALDAEIHGTYSPKDALAQLNGRIQELERAVRDSARQPVPITQK